MTADNKITTSFVRAIFLSYARNLKGTFSGLRQFLATESPLKMTKNAFYFTSEPLLFSRYLSFCFYFLVMYQNGLIKVNFTFYDVAPWPTNHCTTHIVQCLEK